MERNVEGNASIEGNKDCNMEKISVIIPTYNREQTIKKAVETVLEQTYSNLELIVVDDGSTDGTEQVVKEIDDERIIYIKKETNQGVAAARNTGVMHASAELIAFHDSDDEWHLDKLEKQMNYWKEHPEYDMIYCGYHLHCIDGTVISVPHGETCEKLEGNIYQELLMENRIGAPTILMRRASFLEVGGFDVGLKSLEDAEFVIRYGKDHLIGYAGAYLMDAYQIGGSVSTNRVAAYEAQCKIIALHRETLANMGVLDTKIHQLFQHAQHAGVLEPVKKMLMLYLNLR